METIRVEQLGRAGADIAEEIGYKNGARDVINRVSNWLDEDTINELRKEFNVQED